MAIQVRVRNGIRPDPISGEGGVTEGDFRGEFSDIIDDDGGVPYLNNNHLVVSQNSPVGMSVLVDPGIGYIPNANFDPFDSDTVKFWEAVSDDIEVATIASNSSGSTRIDLICLYLNVVTAPDEFASNIVSVVVVQGTPGAGIPAIPDDHLALARVSVANGATSITDANITDMRIQPQIKSDFIPLVGAPLELQTLVQTNLGGAFNASSGTAEQEVTGLRYSLPIIAGGTSCTLDIDLRIFLTAVTGDNTVRVRVGPSTSYLSNTEQLNLYTSTAGTNPTFSGRKILTGVDLTTQKYVVISYQNGTNASGASISASGSRSNHVVAVYN